MKAGATKDHQSDIEKLAKRLSKKFERKVTPDDIFDEFVAEINNRKKAARRQYFPLSLISLSTSEWFELLWLPFREKKHLIEGFVLNELLPDKRSRLTFSRNNILERNSDPKKQMMFSYLVSEGFEESLSFKDVLQQVKRDINNGTCRPDLERWNLTLQDRLENLREGVIPKNQRSNSYNKPGNQKIPDVVKSRLDILGERVKPDLLQFLINHIGVKRVVKGKPAGALDWIQFHIDRQDENVVEAIKDMRTLFFRSQEPGIRFLRQWYEKRTIDLYNGTSEQRTDANRFFRKCFLLARHGTRKSDFPDAFYVSGLIYFLLPIAWDLRSKYLIWASCDEKKKKFSGKYLSAHDSQLEEQMQSVDPRLVQIIKDDELSQLIDSPMNYIKKTLLPGSFDVDYDTIKERLKKERNR